MMMKNEKYLNDSIFRNIENNIKIEISNKRTYEYLKSMVKMDDDDLRKICNLKNKIYK